MGRCSVDLVFAAAVAILAALLVGAGWSAVYPARRVWPPQSRGTWQHWLTWALFYLLFALNAALLALDWNSWIFGGVLRFVLAVPLVGMGALLVGWGVATLGVRNTSGIRDRLVASGPYASHEIRNISVTWFCLSASTLIAKPRFLWITHCWTVMVFTIAPLAEECWLQERYGEDFLRKGSPLDRTIYYPW